MLSEKSGKSPFQSESASNQSISRANPHEIFRDVVQSEVTSSDEEVVHKEAFERLSLVGFVRNLVSGTEAGTLWACTAIIILLVRVENLRRRFDFLPPT